MLLDLGVDGSTYDDRLLTPLDHLARKVYMNFPFPSRVVDTIRALVERGNCRPLLPLTSNTVSFYRGPEEGFVWLFTSEYAGVKLEQRDSEGWTLLGDAAFNFGWWTQLCVEDTALCWQSLYLLRAGVNPHAMSAEGRLTPLDAYLRGCTSHQVEHARKWLDVLKETGINLHKYAKEEQRLHAPEHLLRVTWDEQLFKWIPTKRKVIYKYGEACDQLEIWLEDYDALGWFRGGRYDLDIFQVISSSDSVQRWKELNARDDYTELIEIEEEARITAFPAHSDIFDIIGARWMYALMFSFAIHYLYLFYKNLTSP
jgi:hypothetical protein